MRYQPDKIPGCYSLNEVSRSAIILSTLRYPCQGERQASNPYITDPENQNDNDFRLFEGLKAKYTIVVWTISIHPHIGLSDCQFPVGQSTGRHCSKSRLNYMQAVLVLEPRDIAEPLILEMSE